MSAGPHRALLAAVLAAATAAAGEPGQPALAPLPRLAPALPQPEDPAMLSESERLLRRLSQEIRARDAAIAELARAGTGMRPPAAASDDPALAAPRQARDRARDELAAALAAYAGRAARPSADPIESARPAAMERQRLALSAANRLAIAQVRQEILADGGGGEPDIADALECLTGIEDAGLPEMDRPLAAYLRLWFSAERARRASDPAAGAHAAAQARAALADLESRYPASDLLTAARAAVAALPAPATGEAP